MAPRAMRLGIDMNAPSKRPALIYAKLRKRASIIKVVIAGLDPAIHADPKHEKRLS
jgi:hypothetical protein